MTSATSPNDGSGLTLANERRLGPRDYVILLSILATVCLLYEFLRTQFPRDRSSLFVIVVLLHRVVVLVCLGILWHRLLGQLFRMPADKLVWGVVLLVLLIVCVVGLAYAASSEETGSMVARAILGFAFNKVVLPLYVYLGLYGRLFLALVLAAGAFLLGVHWCSHNWRGRGWVHAVAGRCVERYLQRNPDGVLYLALRAIHWETLGHTSVDTQYESKLKALVAAGEPMLHQERLSRFRTKLTALNGSSPPHSADRRRQHRFMANLACCLTAPLKNNARFAARLVDAAEIYYELQLAALSPSNSQASARVDLADSIPAAKSFERRVYKHLIGQDSCRPHPSWDSLPVFWRQALNCYMWTCHRWQRLPDWLKAWSLLDASEASAGTWKLSTRQAKLVRYLIDPSDKIEDLHDALVVAKSPTESENDPAGTLVLAESLVDRLIWLAIAKWMAQVETQGPLCHEALIDGFTRLRCTVLPPEFWKVDTSFELGNARRWVQAQCVTTLGAAWLVYWHLLTGIHGNEDYREFAYRQATSNLTAGNAECLLSAVSQRSEADPCPTPTAKAC